LIKFTFFICNQQLFFIFIILYPLYTNDNDNNGNRPPTMNITFEFPMEPMWEKNENLFKLECKNWWHNDYRLNCNENMHVTFFKALFRFDTMLKKSSSQTCISTNVVHAFLYEAISPQSDFGQNCPTNHNANMHSLDLPCSYL
jgi:hypothetical protein